MDLAHLANTIRLNPTLLYPLVVYKENYFLNGGGREQSGINTYTWISISHRDNITFQLFVFYEKGIYC